MRDHDRWPVESSAPDARPRRAPAPEHPLLTLQRTAGNAAVSRLVADLAVQRFLPPDDEEEDGEPEEPGEGEEKADKNPEEFPNAPAEAPLPDPEVAVQWIGMVDRGGVRVFSVPLQPSAMVESSRAVVAEYARSLPYEAIPPEVTGGGGEPLLADARKILTTLQLVVSRQLFRAWAGNVSPDIERIVKGPGGSGGPSGPGGGPAPGGGPVPGGGPGGIPGMEPVPPGGGAPGPGGIPGMEPVPPGGAAGPGGIPGMEPVPPAGGPGGIPGMEPVPPGGEAAPGTTEARPTLRIGSVGDAVRQAQELLVRHGASLDPDGQFGSMTQRAVIDFQRASGLDPDGIIGRQTWHALESA